MEITEVKPKSLPTELLPKDWSKRKIFGRKGPCVDFYDKVHDMKVRDDDTWIVTHEKSGTTWMQELVWLVLHDFDFEAAKQQPLELRSPFLELANLLGFQTDDLLKTTEEAKSPRLIKSHLPLPLLPKELWTKKPKLIYVYRNPKDAFVSRYFFFKDIGNFTNITLQQSLDQKLEFERKTSQHFQHVTEFYQLRHEPWVLYTSFERMKSNLREVILEVCLFLHKPITDEQMQQMLKHLSFEEMKNNPQCNHEYEYKMMRKIRNLPIENNFMRKGKVGTYKEELSPELITELDEWIEDDLKSYNVTLDDLLLTAPKTA